MLGRARRAQGSGSLYRRQPEAGIVSLLPMQVFLTQARGSVWVRGTTLALDLVIFVLYVGCLCSHSFS